MPRNGSMLLAPGQRALCARKQSQSCAKWALIFQGTAQSMSMNLRGSSWLNPDAPANWLADVEKWRKGLGVTYEHLSYEMGFWNVEGSSAYAVISGTLSVTIKGQSVVRTGTLAYTFAKREGIWKIEAQAWGRTS